MADQKKWFKVWTTLLIDSLSTKVEDIGRFTILGCLIASRGENGKLVTDKNTLQTLLQCKDIPVNFIKNFNVIIEEINGNSNGDLLVTLKNWHKYQVDDSTYRTRKWRQIVTEKVTRKVTAQDKIRLDKIRLDKIRLEKKKNIYGEFKNVKLSDDEYQKLISKIGQEETDNWIKAVDEGIEQKGYKYKSHYLTILKWKGKEDSKGGPYR